MTLNITCGKIFNLADRLARRLRFVVHSRDLRPVEHLFGAGTPAALGGVRIRPPAFAVLNTAPPTSRMCASAGHVPLVVGSSGGETAFIVSGSPHAVARPRGGGAVELNCR